MKLKTYFQLLSGFIFLQIGQQIYAQNGIQLGDSIILSVEEGYRGEIQWQYSNDSIQWFNIPNANRNDFPILPSIDVYYRAVITEEGCDPFYSPIVKYSGSEIQKLVIEADNNVVLPSDTIEVMLFGIGTDNLQFRINSKDIQYYNNGLILPDNKITHQSLESSAVYASFGGLVSDSIWIEYLSYEDINNEYIPDEELAILEGIEPIDIDINELILPNGMGVMEFAYETGMKEILDLYQYEASSKKSQQISIDNRTLGPDRKKWEIIVKSTTFGYYLQDDRAHINRKRKDGTNSFQPNGLAYLLGQWGKTYGEWNNQDFKIERFPYLGCNTQTAEFSNAIMNQIKKMRGLDCSGYVYHSYHFARATKLYNVTADKQRKIVNWNTKYLRPVWQLKAVDLGQLDREEFEPGDIVWFDYYKNINGNPVPPDGEADHIGFVGLGSNRKYIFHSPGSSLYQDGVCGILKSDFVNRQKKNMDETHGPVIMNVDQINHWFKPGKVWGITRLVPDIAKIEEIENKSESGSTRSLKVQVLDGKDSPVPVPFTDIYWYIEGNDTGGELSSDTEKGRNIVTTTDQDGYASVSWNFGGGGEEQKVIVTGNYSLQKQDTIEKYNNASVSFDLKSWYEGCWHETDSPVNYSIEDNTIQSNSTFQENLNLQILTDTIVFSYNYSAGQAYYYVENRLGYDAINDWLDGRFIHKPVRGNGIGPYENKIVYKPCEE